MGEFSWPHRSGGLAALVVAARAAVAKVGDEGAAEHPYRHAHPLQAYQATGKHLNQVQIVV